MAKDVPVITRILEEQRVTPAGALVTMHRVEFTVGGHGPFSVEFTRADFNPANVKAGMQQLADTVNALS